MIKLKSIKNFMFGNIDEDNSEKYFLIVTTITATIFLWVLSIAHILLVLKLASVFLALLGSIIMLGLFYLIRFRNWIFLPKIVLTISGLILLDLAWYAKYLSNGPILFFILIFAALVIWVWEGKYLLILLLFYFLNLLSLFYIDYYAPDSLKNYPDPHTKSYDIFLSFFLYSILLISLLYIVKREFIKQKERAIKSDQLKSAFLANMSHEIRTPMNGILGFSNLLKDPNISAEKQQRYIEIIEKSGHRLLNIINDIIDISKIESGLIQVQSKKTNINEQLEYIYTFFKPEIESKMLNFSIKNNLPKDFRTVKTDTEKLYAVLINLVKNAIKFTDVGAIEIGCDLIKQNENVLLQFFVKDTGIGVAKDKQAEIFERFIQADIADTMARQGSGLGLSITKAYIDMLGGKIWLESEEGKGSIFYFTIPYKHNGFEIITPLNLNTVIKEKNKTPKLKILIVEDDEISEILITNIIQPFSKEFLIARDGFEAVEACRNNTDIDLVLMDIQLQEMNGYEATEQIRKFNKNVVIIAQTAFALEGDKEKVYKSGFNDYISKPINSKLLLDKLKNHFK